MAPVNNNFNQFINITEIQQFINTAIVVVQFHEKSSKGVQKQLLILMADNETFVLIEKNVLKHALDSELLDNNKCS